MSTLVVYESMYGTTRQLAEVIADELADARRAGLGCASGEPGRARRWAARLSSVRSGQDVGP